MADHDGGFVARWSRRKRGEEPREDAETSEEAAPAPRGTESGEAAAAEPVETDIVAQLPDIESLDESADFTVFLEKGVPEELRKRALRRLWRLNPVFANLDGLAEYDEDFNTATTLLEGLKTVYQVGKGMPGPAEPQGDEPQGDEAQVDRRETSGAPAGDDTAPSGDGGPIEDNRESGPPDIAQTPVESGADQREQAALPDIREPAAAKRSDLVPGRSAVERRWGRAES